MAHQTFVWFFVTVHKSMRIPIISAVECLAAHFTGEWLNTGMNSNVLLVMLRINKGGITFATFVWPFAGVCCFDMVLEKATPFE